jgi:hypothetical protein
VGLHSTNSQPPDIHDFDLQIEISKIHPVLWNFIFRMTASEDEEKMLRKNTFDWECQLSTPFYLCFSWGDCKREERDLM